MGGAQDSPTLRLIRCMAFGDEYNKDMSIAPAIPASDVRPQSPPNSSSGALAQQLLKLSGQPELIDNLAPLRQRAFDDVFPIRRRSDWLLDAHVKLSALGKLVHDWDGCGAAAPMRLAIESAEKSFKKRPNSI